MFIFVTFTIGGALMGAAVQGIGPLLGALFGAAVGIIAAPDTSPKYSKAHEQTAIGRAGIITIAIIIFGSIALCALISLAQPGP